MSKLLARITIRTKFVLAFAAVLCCATGLGLFALERLDAVNNAAAVVGNLHLQQTRLLGQLSYQTMRFRQLEATAVLAPDAAARAQEEATMAKVRAQAAQVRQAYEQLGGAGEERQAAAQTMQGWNAYLVLDDKFMALAQAGDMAPPIAFYRGEMRTEFNRFQDALTTLVNHSDGAAKHAVDEASVLGRSAYVWILGILAMVTLLCVGIGVSMVRGISMPIRAMTDAMRKLADKDVAVAIPGADRGDEIGDMAGAVQVFKDSMIRADELAAAQKTSQAARERRQAAMEQHTQDFGASIGGVMASLAQAADGIRAAAETMATATHEVHGEAHTTAENAAQASQDLASVAAAVEQLTSSVAEISRQVAAAADVARQAVQRTEASQGSIHGLNDATARIGDVVHLISSIAAQTNLLALNATIEAARAGEAGKGFAVVAGEVKTLAAQTAKATADIGGQIEMVRSAAADAVTAMNEVGGIIGTMNQVSAAISAAVEEQSATTQELAGSVQAISGRIAGTASAMEHVVEVADGAGTASRDVLAVSSSIGREAETLRVEVDQFFAAVRDDSGERRRYERVDAKEAVATLRASGHSAQVRVMNVSRGGALVACDWPLAAGTSFEIELPTAGGGVTGRVAHCSKGSLGLIFSSDPAMLARVDRVLDALRSRRAAA